MITLRQLRYLEAIARLEHFGRAAQACSITQPALSMQIRELEAELGLTLVERLPRGVRLTEAGREIARRGERILAQVRDLEDYAHHGSALLSGPLNLGVIPTVAPYLLPHLLAELANAYPALEPRIRETRTERLVQLLLEGGLDVVLVALPVEHSDLASMALFEDRFLLAMPASRKMAARARVTPDLLRNDRLLLLEEGHCLREQALAVCELKPTGNLDTFGATSLATIVQMVASGFGLTLLPEISLDVEARGRSVRLMRFSAPEPSRTLGLVWRASSPRTRDFEALGAALLKTVATRAGHGRRPAAP